MRYPEVFTIRMPSGTETRIREHLAPGTLPVAFWRALMLSWLDGTDPPSRTQELSL